MIVIEELQYAIIGKISNGWTELEDLHIQILIQLKVKGDCRIGFLRNHHILMRFNLIKDFINGMSKNVYYINDKDGYSYQMRPLIYDAKFKIEEETSQAMAWISFPDLKPTLFMKESLFPLATAVGKPIHLDLATVNKTRPNCAKVKVQVDLLADLPKCVETEIVKSTTKESRVEQVKIKYDFLPKYCKKCMLQGHNEQEYKVITNDNPFEALTEEGDDHIPVNNTTITSISKARGINKQGEIFENQMSTKEWISSSFHSHGKEKQATLPASITSNTVDENQRKSAVEATEEDNITDQHKEQIHRYAYLSPRIIKNLKYARKGEKQGNGEVPQPIRLQPKRGEGSQPMKK
ncbi:hypothetical protein H5410_022221 [Solanum commersonii]|uniref:DUF4283 domain-containing protein n=1 Tax=Solanum commersonii TaxID=4109 RepID=A0A9J5ZHF6_SOLCO|nr:hypothetical protein H5410_022221 [Solanum commersonii]